MAAPDSMDKLDHQSYDGIILNGTFYPKSSLEIHDSDVFRFAAQFFDDSTSLTVHSSGSTGKPKAMEFPKSALIQSALATIEFFGLGPNTKAGLFLPLSFIAGKMMVIRAIVGGFDLHIHSPSSAPLSGEIDFDFIPLTPHQLDGCIDQIEAPKTTFLIGGGSMSPKLIQKALYKNLHVFASFGMTETLTHFALAKVREGGLTYQPLKGVEIDVDDDSALRINWPGITDGWIQTNDLIQRENLGFRWLGRRDNLINSGGVKLIPERLESRLEGSITNSFFIAGMPDDRLGQRVVLFTEGKVDDLDLSTIEWESPIHKPREVIELDRFLYTESGKIRRSATADAYLKNKG